LVSCKQNILLTNYCCNDSSGSLVDQLTINLEDSTFIRKSYFSVGGPTLYKGRVKYLTRNKIHLKVRTSQVYRIPFPDTLNRDYALIDVLNWDRFDNNDTLPKFPYQIIYKDSLIGEVNKNGIAILKIDKSIKELVINPEDSFTNSAKIQVDSFQGTAWKVLLGNKPQIRTKSFYYKIKEGYLKSKLGLEFWPCKDPVLPAGAGSSH
jgi:hypothetical protein